MSKSNFIPYEQDMLPSGVYKVKTDKGRIMNCEMFLGWWMETDTDALEGEKITHVNIN